MVALVRNIFFISISLLLLGACKGSKKAITFKQKSENEVKATLQDHNISYEWFTAVGKIRLSNPEQSVAAKVYLRIQRDSAIWMVVKKLGIEVARALITPESFTIIYRLENVYEQESLQTLMDSYNANLSFRELQDYIIGNIPELDPANFEMRQTDTEVICQTMLKGMKSFIKLDLENMHLRSFELFNDKNESVKGDFADFRAAGDYIVPYKRSFSIQSIEHGDMKAELEFSELQIDLPKSMKFSVPPHYEKLKYYRPF